MPKLKEIEIDGSRLAYEERGKGEPVILVHGDLADFRSWSAQLEALSHHYRVISYSRRFHYPNTLLDGGKRYSHRQHVDDLVSLIDSLRLKPAHLLGHSYGAAVAVLAAMEQPELVRSLILCEPALFSILSRWQDRMSLAFHRVSLGVVQKLAETEEQSQALSEYVNVVIGKDVFEDLSKEARLEITQNAHTLLPMLKSSFEPIEMDLNRVGCLRGPTLVISGECSPRLYRRISSELHRSLTNSELQILAGASLGLQMDERNDLNNAVLGFLNRPRP